MSLLATQKLVIQAGGGADKWESRMGTVGSWAKILRDSNLPNGIITQEYREQANRSQGAGLALNLLDFNDNVTVTATRPLVLTPAIETSARQVVTFSTVQATISIIPSVHRSNEVAMEEAFRRSYRDMIIKVRKKLNELALAYLEANKATGVVDELNHTFNATSDELEVAYTSRDAILGDATIIQNANDLYANMDVVGNSNTQSLLNAIMEKGVYNTDNKTYQYADKNFFFDHSMGSDSGFNSQFFIAPEGSTGMLVRQETDAMLQSMTGDGKRWQVIFDNDLGIAMSEYAYSTAIDGSSLHGAASAHLTRTAIQLYSYSFEVAFVPARVSGTNGFAPILKVSVADAV